MKTQNTFRISKTVSRFLVWTGLALSPAAVNAAGVLTPVNSVDQPIQLESHHVQVVINNGFARTEVEQVFFNPNGFELEAIYRAPVPEHGSLSELTIWAGERVLQGEVVAKEEADRIYEEEKSSGNSVAKASKESYQHFEFTVYPVPANGTARMRYVYYEPLPVDTGVGKYTYRLEEGGTDEEVIAFWSRNNIVTTDISVDVMLKSSWPVAKTRTPGFSGNVDAIDENTVHYTFNSQGGSLDQDFVFYYMLEENLPGRVEMATYRESEDKPGTFMMVMTPGVDLQPLTQGADYVFVLDVSGSMQGKLHTLISGVKKAIGQLQSQDRFRIVAFSDTAWDMTGNWILATPENVADTIDQLDGLQVRGGTNVYAGVELGMNRMDADRVSSLILVTDGVTNQGIVNPSKFYKLLHAQDVRFFGFLLGNSSNWPLMQVMCDASGGYYRAVSNSDDIIGEIMIAKNKIVYESMHDAELKISGVKTFDVSDFKIGKIHYGDQLILFGRYEEGGSAKLSLRARISGEDKLYETDILFPDTDGSHPELERMWALDQVQKIELNEAIGFLSESESKQAIRDIGVAYQIVTDETSMIALDDASFARRGMDRKNQDRIAREQLATQSNPTSSGAKRVDTNKPMYKKRAPSFGGGGAIEPWMFILTLSGGAVVYLWRRKKMASSGVLSAFVAFVALGISQPSEASSTTRDESTVRLSNSIDHSIANFWEVSEEEAEVSERPKRITPEPLKTRPERARTVVVERVENKDTHKLNQSRRKNGSSGHFGVNILNAIPLFDIVWGEKSESESDEYSGSLKRK